MESINFQKDSLLSATNLSNKCDFNFGSLAVGNNRPANLSNQEFIERYNSIKKGKEFITLFIDNLRLYRRPIDRYNAMEDMSIWLYDKYDYSKYLNVSNNSHHKSMINSHRHSKDNLISSISSEDLLDTCKSLSDTKFVIFSGYEDTPVDKYVYDKIPDNVICIFSANSNVIGGKVIPMPFGIQNDWDGNRWDNLLSLMNVEIDPTNILYLNHSLGCNPNRIPLKERFYGLSWATFRDSWECGSYDRYLLEIKNHKFMICPEGNAIGCDCFRNWEVLYMRRVPVVIRSDVFEKIFENLPVLMVDDFSEVTEELLTENEHLYQKARDINFDELNMNIMFNKMISYAKKLL